MVLKCVQGAKGHESSEVARVFLKKNLKPISEPEAFVYPWMLRGKFAHLIMIDRQGTDLVKVRVGTFDSKLSRPTETIMSDIILTFCTAPSN